MSSIFAVRKDDAASEIVVAEMCGRCRQIFFDYAPDVNVETFQGLVKISDILPHPFTRQQSKIQSILNGV